MFDGVFRQATVQQLRVAPNAVARRIRQRVIILGEYQPQYCVRPPAQPEIMPWDDAPEIIEVDEE